MDMDRQQATGGADAAQDQAQITCKFVTKLPADFKVPAAPVAVPATTTRLGLSQIVNTLRTPKRAQAFDFLVNGELVRSSLEAILLANKISAESVLEVEYLLAVVPPQPEKELPHDDWVSAVDGSRPSMLISGSCDGRLYLWSASGLNLGAMQLHSGSITALQAIPGPASLLLSAGKDHVARVSHVPQLRNTASSKTVQTSASEVEVKGVFRGHTDAVECLAAAPSGASFCSGSWDACINLWQTQGAPEAGQEAAGGTAGRKRQKAGSTGSAAQAAPPDHEAVQRLAGHTQCVAGVAWPTQSRIVSCSWDHSARTWDVEASASVDTFNAGHALYCLSASREQPHAVAVAGAGKAVRLWDTRLPASSQAAGAKALKSHTEWISAVQWHPTDPHRLLSASHDKTIKQWDVRASVPLFTLQGHTERVLCACWREDGLASGGADSTLRFWDNTIP
ncbi:hypothetical protein WJX73_002312 [Symbiochloris irregularis]|uniref:Ribosome biogenesis protein WDR12 homolog n=1 Tax=Symbiochloris irregularis TaxID=706552 RepID=A0AAW1NIG9_9CHLO